MRKFFTVLTSVSVLVTIWILVLHSKGTAIGRPAPDFTLLDTKGQEHRLSDYNGEYVVMEWVNHGCPFVKKHYKSRNMQSLQKEFRKKGVIWLSVCSSAEGRQGFFSAKEWKKIIRKTKSKPTAVLLDSEGVVGRLYGAKTTPHMFIIDPDGNLIYKGAIDDKPSTDIDDIKDAKNFVRMALEEVLEGKSVKYSSTRSYGCSVKYKKEY